MEKIYQIRKFTFFILSIIILSACQDIVDYDQIQKESETSTGAPTIGKITLVDRETEISEANLSQLVLIQGTNLSGLESIKFNDIEADLKEAYIKAKEIIVPVPRILPGEVNDKVTITTELGQTSADLIINVPDLVIEGLFNEFALPGDTTTIVGDNFDLYKLNMEDCEISLGGAGVKILEATQKTLTIQIPESINAEEATFTIATPTLDEPLHLRYRHTGTLINIQNKLWSGEQWLTDGTKLDDPKPINGQFSHITGVTVGEWGWYDQIHGCNFPVKDLDIINNLENYDLKFELNTDPDHPLSQMFIKFSMRFSITYEWNLYNSGESLNTYGKWQTITLDAKTVMGELYENNDNYFYFAINPSVQMNLDFSISSMRLVKKETIIE